MSLGSSIPIHAFAKCMTAILCVRLGNAYGVSFAAQPFANQMLDRVTSERWVYFFDKCLPADDLLLGALENTAVADQWCEFLGREGRIARSSLSRKRDPPDLLRHLWMAIVTVSGGLLAAC